MKLVIFQGVVSLSSSTKVFGLRSHQLSLFQPLLSVNSDLSEKFLSTCLFYSFLKYVEQQSLRVLCQFACLGMRFALGAAISETSGADIFCPAYGVLGCDINCTSSGASHRDVTPVRKYDSPLVRQASTRTVPCHTSSFDL